MNLPRSTFYYRTSAPETGPTEAEITALMKTSRMSFPATATGV